MKRPRDEHKIRKVNGHYLRAEIDAVLVDLGKAENAQCLALLGQCLALARDRLLLLKDTKGNYIATPPEMECGAPGMSGLRENMCNHLALGMEPDGLDEEGNLQVKAVRITCSNCEGR